MDPLSWTWQYRNASQWTNFEEKDSIKLSIAFTSRSNAPLHIGSATYILSTDTPDLQLIYASSPRKAPIKVRHVMDDEFSLPPLVTSVNPPTRAHEPASTTKDPSLPDSGHFVPQQQSSIPRFADDLSSASHALHHPPARVSPRSLIKSEEFPLPPTLIASELHPPATEAATPASHNLNAQLIAEVFTTTENNHKEASPRLEGIPLIEKLADSLLAGTSLLNTSVSQRLRNGQLQYILGALDMNSNHLVSVLEIATAKSGGLASLSHSVVIPTGPRSDEAPHLCQLWETTVTLNSHTKELVEWEILSPTRADGTSFFTCAHRLSDSQTAFDEPAEDGWTPSRDPYIFKGSLLPDQQLPLLLSYVPLHLPKRKTSNNSFTHMVCIRLTTLSQTSFAFIALRAKSPVLTPNSTLYWSVPRNEVYRGQKLGQGSFGSVYRATIRGLRCSLKYWPQITLDFDIELRALSQFRHDHLIPFIGAYDSSDNTQPIPRDGEGFVILKYATEGNLYQYYTRPGFSEAHAFHFAHEIALGLQYLHSRDCIHRDIKSLNVLVDNGSACLIDFGSVRKSDDAKRSTTKTGSLPWVAPEVMTPTPTYSKATDIFSFGLVLYELASKTPPPVRAHEHILKGAVPLIPAKFAKAFPEYQELYRLCTQRNPDNRASVDLLVKVLSLMTQRYPIDDTKPLPEGSIATFESSVFNDSLLNDSSDFKPPPRSVDLAPPLQPTKEFPDPTLLP